MNDDRSREDKGGSVFLDHDGRALHVELEFSDPDVLAVFSELEPEERQSFAERAFKVGSIALRDATTVGKADYVDKAFERMQREVQRTFEEFLGGDGKLSVTFDRVLGSDGKMAQALERTFGPDGRLRRELDREFDEDGGRLSRLLNPNDDGMPLGELRATLEARLDPEREGSLLWALRDLMNQEFAAIRERLGIQEAVEAEAEKGTQKGLDFEEYVGELLERTAATFGDRIDATGRARGTAGELVGDFVCHIAPEDSGGLDRRVAVEAKNTSITLTGKNSFHIELDRAVANRDAHFALGVVEASHAGRWAPLRYVAPDHIYVAVDTDAEEHLPLEVAYRLARTLCCARAASREASLDTATVERHLDRISRQLDQIRAIKRHLTTASSEIESVRGMLDDLREGIADALTDLHEALQSGHEVPLAPAAVEGVA